jgi:hypothetical protein
VVKRVERISFLLNSGLYFLEHVFIIDCGDSFQLEVIHNDKVLTDETYPDIDSARSAFKKMYGHKAWKKRIKTRWSPFYKPDENWANDKLH